MKIRGWKRRVVHIEKWFEANVLPDLDHFEKQNNDYVKIWIDPFYRLNKTNPPLWYFRLITQKMALIFENWESEFQKQGADYDLQLWIFEKEYIRSEVVCAKANRRDYFDKSPFFKELPFEKFGKHLQNLHWEYCEVIGEDENDLPYKIDNVWVGRK